MYGEHTYESILERMQDRVPDILDKRPSSIIFDTQSSAALEFQALYMELEHLVKNSYGDTASREFLELLAKDRGMMPHEATCAILRGKFTPASVDVTGKRFSIEDVQYTVLERMEDGIYKVLCDQGGTVGNRFLGRMIPLDYIEGLETAELTGVLVPGEDEEETETFRKRYFSSFDSQAFGGNRADYLEKVRNIGGVGDVKVDRVWNGDIRAHDLFPNENVQSWYTAFMSDDSLHEDVKRWLSSIYSSSMERSLNVGGTVLLTIVNSSDYGSASATLLDHVQTVTDPEGNQGEGFGIAPIGHVVFVQSATPIPILVSTRITFRSGSSFLTTRDSIEASVDGYLLELRKGWATNGNLTVRISQIENRILSIEGVIDVENTRINGVDSNLILEKYEIPILGGVEYDQGD